MCVIIFWLSLALGHFLTIWATVIIFRTHGPGGQNILSWNNTICTLYSQCIELSRLIQTKQGRLSKPSSTNCPGRLFGDTFEDAQWRKVKSHTNNAGALLKPLVTKLSTVGAFLPPTRLDCVQSSNNNLMTSRHTVCPSQKRKTYHHTISMSPN